MPESPDETERPAAIGLRGLLPPGAPSPLAHLIDDLDLAERASGGERERPYVALNMVSTAAAGTIPDCRITMSKYFSAPRSAAKPHSFTT